MRTLKRRMHVDKKAALSDAMKQELNLKIQTDEVSHFDETMDEVKNDEHASEKILKMMNEDQGF